MLAEARRMQILDLISRAGEGGVSVIGLSRQLSVSEMTIRRDLDWLEERAIVKRVHGGAIAYPSTVPEKPFDDRLLESSPQKKSIGWAAAQLVNDGDRIILDAGTTMQQIARNLTCKNDLTVITNNLPAVLELARCPNIKTFILGGELKHKELCTVGGMMKSDLGRFSADKYFMSVAGFSLKNGLTDPDLYEVEGKQSMMQAAERVILAADSSKWGIAALVKIAPLSEVDQLVTDDDLPEEAAASIQAQGVEVITPERLPAGVAGGSTLRQENKEK